MSSGLRSSALSRATAEGVQRFVRDLSAKAEGNLGLVMRHQIGIGTPRGLQDRPATVMAALLALLRAPRRWLVAISAWHPLMAAVRWFPSPITTTGNSSAPTTFTTVC
jgi:hypothetical protein